MTKQFWSIGDDEFAAVFPRATNLAWAVAVLTGEIQLSTEQDRFLRLCRGSGYRLNSEPRHGHLAVRVLGTEGCGNRAADVILVPASDECRRLVNRIRRERWARAFAASAGIPVPQAERLWHAARGHKPTLDYVEEVWPFRGLSDRALREAGFRPGHPIEGRAIEIARAI